MTTATQEKQEKKFSKAQVRHLNELRSEVNAAQIALNKYIAYLGDEHEIEMDGTWALGIDGFVKPTPPTNGDGATPIEGEGQPPAE